MTTYNNASSLVVSILLFQEYLRLELYFLDINVTVSNSLFLFCCFCFSLCFYQTTIKDSGPKCTWYIMTSK